MEQPEPLQQDPRNGHSTNPASYGESFADVYDEWYGQLSTDAELSQMVACLLDCAHTAEPLILELGAGTGRLAIPLVEAGATVFALDGSSEMLRQMDEKLSARASQPLSICADMSLVPLAEGSVDGAFVAYNTFFNLATEADQERCLVDVARVLAPGGFLAIEAFTPVTDHGDKAPSLTRSPVSTTERAVFVASRVDAAAQQIRGAHLDLGPDGLRLRPWHVRYLTPAQLDLMASDVGLTLEHRWNSWACSTFDGTAGKHVSVYRSSTATV